METPLLIHQLIEEYAKKNKDAIATVEKNTLYTYQQLNLQANQLAHYLQKYRKKTDTIIAIAIERSTTLLIGILSILKAGYAYLPIELDYPESVLEYILTDSQAPLLITLEKYKEKFSSYKGEIIFLDRVSFLLSQQPSHNPVLLTTANNLAYVIYTSGSTGKPKGVLIEHKSLTNYTQWFKHYSHYQPQNISDFSATIAFDMTVSVTICSLAMGLKIVICPPEIKKDVRLYLQHLHDNNINIIKITPSYFKIMIQAIQQRFLELDDLKTIILGGEIVLTKDCLSWLQLYPNHCLFNEYGPTETTIAITSYKITKDNVYTLKKIVPIGKPGFNIKCFLLNENKIPVSVGDIGELYIGGVCVARGYLNQETLTATRFLRLPQLGLSLTFYKTGDLCHLLPDGNLVFLGRIDDQIKLRGYRVEPAEIETALMSHSDIENVTFKVLENSDREKKLILYYILKDKEKNLSFHEIRSFLKGKLADYMIPSFFIKMEAFPINENGKLDKKSLPDPILEEQDIFTPTLIEQKLINIWEQVFKLKHINIYSNFFELGGHSLLAARIIIEIEKNFQKKISLKDLYTAKSIKNLAKFIEKSEFIYSKETHLIPSNNYRKLIPLSDFQLMLWFSTLFEPKAKKLNIVARRRLSGRIEKKDLLFSFKKVVSKHQMLSYGIKKFFPDQFLKKNLIFDIDEKNISSFEKNKMESYLLDSLNKLYYHKKWPKNLPSIKLKLFHLSDKISEIQMSVPHIIFDDFSEDILFAELSNFYLSCNGRSIIEIEDEYPYQYYIFSEKKYLNQNLETDINFWKNYLRDTHLTTFPRDLIIHKMGNIPYSTYCLLPSSMIDAVQAISKYGHVSLSEIFCASITLALKKLTGNLNNKIFVNIIRSLRDNKIYDKTIGCFLTLNPLIVDVQTNLTLIDLARDIQKSRLETEPYQGCSGLVKLACLNQHYKPNFIKNILIYVMTFIYSLFSKSKLNYKILTLYSRLSSLRTYQQFLINLNILNNFVTRAPQESLFNFNLLPAPPHHFDMINVNNVLDICFLKNDDNQLYLVISGNLKDSFRKHLGREIINNINEVAKNKSWV